MSSQTCNVPVKDCKVGLFYMGDIDFIFLRELLVIISRKGPPDVMRKVPDYSSSQSNLPLRLAGANDN